MYPPRPLSFVFAAFLIVGFTAVSVTFPRVPLGVNVAQGFEGSEGGSSGGSTGGSTGGDAGGGQNGGHRGHSTNVSRVVIRFLAQVHQVGMTEGQVPRWHPYTAPLQQNQIDYLCSLQRYFTRLGRNEITMYILAEISAIMDYPADAVAAFLRNPLSCKKAEIRR